MAGGGVGVIGGFIYSYSSSRQTATVFVLHGGGLLSLDLIHQGESSFKVRLVNAETGDEVLLVK